MNKEFLIKIKMLHQLRGLFMNKMRLSTKRQNTTQKRIKQGLPW